MSWKELANFPNYEVHPYHGVRRKGKDKPLKGRNWIGYPKVTLMRDGKKFERRIHRLVGETHLSNPNGLPILNHKNSNRAHFMVDNLEWVNNSENQRHRWDTEKNPKIKKIKYTPEYGGEKKMQTEKAQTMVKTASSAGRYSRRMNAIKKAKKAKEIEQKSLKQKYDSMGMGAGRKEFNLAANSLVGGLGKVVI